MQSSYSCDKYSAPSRYSPTLHQDGSSSWKMINDIQKDLSVWDDVKLNWRPLCQSAVPCSRVKTSISSSFNLSNIPLQSSPSQVNNASSVASAGNKYLSRPWCWSLSHLMRCLWFKQTPSHWCPSMVDESTALILEVPVRKAKHETFFPLEKNSFTYNDGHPFLSALSLFLPS